MDAPVIGNPKYLRWDQVYFAFPGTWLGGDPIPEWAPTVDFEPDITYSQLHSQSKQFDLKYRPLS